MTDLLPFGPGAWVFIGVEYNGIALTLRDFYRNDLFLEFTSGLRRFAHRSEG